MRVTVRKSSTSELMQHSDFGQLRLEYSEGGHIDGLPPTDAKLSSYASLEATGFFHIFGAFLEDGRLIGLVTVLTPFVPHYGMTVASTESLFVMKAYRQTGAGLRLIRTAERCAKSLGSPALMISAPDVGPLREILPALKYRETAHIYMKVFNG